ncbi:MAG TPA: hypothetical protein VI076_05635 [Actinopolymorphaceae bacterium]
MRRTGAVLAAAAFAVTGLVGCSGGDQAYCDQVQSAQDSMKGAFDNMGEDPAKLSEGMKKAQGEIDKIAAVAPDDVKGEWDSISSGFSKVTPAIEKFKEVDLKNPDPAAMEDLQKFAKEMEQVGKDFESAGKKIEQDAKERCNIDMSS